MGMKPRQFWFEGKRLSDPDPSMKPEDVRDHYAAQHPALTNASPVFSKKDGFDVYTFTKKVGTKG